MLSLSRTRASDWEGTTGFQSMVHTTFEVFASTAAWINRGRAAGPQAQATAWPQWPALAQTPGRVAPRVTSAQTSRPAPRPLQLRVAFAISSFSVRCHRSTSLCGLRSYCGGPQNPGAINSTRRRMPSSDSQREGHEHRMRHALSVTGLTGPGEQARLGSNWGHTVF